MLFGAAALMLTYAFLALANDVEEQRDTGPDLPWSRCC
jgi:hypothetical protein